MTTETDVEQDLRWAVDALKEISVITEHSMRGVGRKIYETIQPNLVNISECKVPEINLNRALRVLKEIRDMVDLTNGGISKPVKFQVVHALTHIAIAQAARKAGDNRNQ
jgi:hypothetical protein